MPIPRALVVVLPGIGGTVLGRPDGRGRPVRDVNGNPVLVWSASLNDATLLARPDRLRIAEHPRLVPVGLLPTRKPFGLFTAVLGYENLVANAAASVPDAIIDDGTTTANLDATVVAFGYDFRLGVEDAANCLNDELQQRLRQLWPDRQQRRSRIIFVAHSMGGLVARYWTATFGAGCTVRAIITLGTPHRGAPKALDVMANGLRVGGRVLPLPQVVGLAREWPGIADLLPRYPIIASSGTSRVEEEDLLRPHEAGISWLTAPASKAWEMHCQIESGWRQLEAPPEMVPRIGFGHRTTRSISRSGNTLTVSPDALPIHSRSWWLNDRGDGTVPAVCALPVEMDNVRPFGFRVASKHGPMVNEDVDGLIGGFLSNEPVSQAYRDAGQPAFSLGLDLDDAVFAGLPTPCRASVWAVTQDRAEAVDTGRSGSQPHLIVVPVNGGPPIADVELRWDSDAAQFVGEIPSLAAGVYDVTVLARHITDTPATQLLEVINDAH